MDHLDAKRRFETLDALRGVACFLVIWQHVSESLRHIASGGLWTSQLADYFDFGRIGVIAFFCISGFVIPSSLKGPRLSGLRSFFINRFYRLYPPYWASIALAVPVFFMTTGYTLGLPQSFANLGMVANFCNQPHIMGLFWTLEIELVFYLSSGALYLFFGDRKFISSLVGFSIAYQIWKRDLLSDSHGNLPLLGLFLSIMFTAAMARCLFELESKKTHAASTLLRWASRAILAYMVYLVTTPFISGIIKSFSYEDPVWNRWGWGHLLGMVLFAVFFLVGKSPNWLSVAGRWTYSAYLMHAIVFELLGRAWKGFGWMPIRLELLILLSATITFGIAYLGFRYVETPFIRIGKDFAKKGHV